ncbi:MAG: ATPase, T2SS/T4P/T4SS family [bacterium]
MKHIITFFSKKEGVGRTTALLNVATALCVEHNMKVAVCEYGYEISDVDIYMNGAGKKKTETTKEIGFKYFKTAGEGLKKLVNQEYAKYDVLFIDMAASETAAVFELSDKVVIVADLTPLGIKYAKTAAEMIIKKNYPPSFITVLFNKVQDNIFSVADARAVLGGLNVAGFLPEQKNIWNKGLYYTKDKKDKFTVAVKGSTENILKGLSSKKHLENISLISFEKNINVVNDLPVKRQETAVGMPGKNVESLEYTKIKKEAAAKLIDEIDLDALEKDTLSNPVKREKAVIKLKDTIRHILDGLELRIADREERENLVEDIVNEAIGLGTLENLLKDASISEIMVNRHDLIYIERKGKLSKVSNGFSDSAALIKAIQRIVMPIGRRIDESSPYVDARLADGSRVNAIIPPLALDGPVVTIRKFSNKKLGMQDLIKFGSISAEAAVYLENAVAIKKNILVSGGTGSGKTTLLNVLATHIPEDERIVTIEDSAELKLPQEHVVRLESRPANIEGEGEVSIRDLVKNALRMRPDRIIVGECRGGETLDMLQAMNTGHEGSMTTLHANTPRDALSRIEVMTLMSGVELPVRAIREQIKGALDIIIQQSRLKDGSRKITHITEITGMEGDVILMHNVFEFIKVGEDSAGNILGELKRADGLKV